MRRLYLSDLTNYSNTATPFSGQVENGCGLSLQPAEAEGVRVIFTTQQIQMLLSVSHIVQIRKTVLRESRCFQYTFPFETDISAAHCLFHSFRKKCKLQRGCH